MARIESLQELMDRRGLAAIVLRRPANFAWYTGGADSRVDRVVAEGVADLIVRPDGALVLTSTIEAPRMRSEQTPELEVIDFPWYEDRDAALRQRSRRRRAGRRPADRGRARPLRRDRHAEAHARPGRGRPRCGPLEPMRAPQCSRRLPRWSPA